MKRYMERFESWTETHRQMRKIVEDFERIAERLGRRINEVAEMQRLSEERFRQEWNDWVADDQKRWKQFTVTNDEAWRNENKQLEALRQRVEEVTAIYEPLKDSRSEERRVGKEARQSRTAKRIKKTDKKHFNL